MRPGETPGVEGLGFLFCRMRSISLKRPIIVDEAGNVVEMFFLFLWVFGWISRASACLVSCVVSSSLSGGAMTAETTLQFCTGLKNPLLVFFPFRRIQSSEIFKENVGGLYRRTRRFGATVLPFRA